MKNLCLVLIFCVFIIGCAATKQVVSDYQLGNNTPLLNSEVSPQQQASVIGNNVSSLPIPFAAPIGVAITFIASLWFTWQRGKSIRKNGGTPPVNSATNSTTTNGFIQDIANIFAGMFTVASTTAPTISGTVFQRVWKTALVTLASGISTAIAIPSFATYLTGHPIEDAIFVSTASIVSGIEKALSNVPTT